MSDHGIPTRTSILAGHAATYVSISAYAGGWSITCSCGRLFSAQTPNTVRLAHAAHVDAALTEAWTITENSVLELLPDETVVRDAHGEVGVRYPDNAWLLAGDKDVGYYSLGHDSMHFPVVVLYLPGGE